METRNAYRYPTPDSNVWIVPYGDGWVVQVDHRGIVCDMMGDIVELKTPAQAEAYTRLVWWGRAEDILCVTHH